MEYKVTLSSIGRFRSWSGATNTLKVVRERGDIDRLTTLCEHVFSGSTPTETDINDWLWFDDAFIYRSLGYDDLIEDE